MIDPPALPTAGQLTLSPRDGRRLRGIGLLLFAVAGLATLLGAVFDVTQLLRSYLMAFVTWWNVALGALALLMLGYVAPGAWTVALRRPFEAAARTVTPLALLFVPIALGINRLYPWATPPVSLSPAVQEKAGYLNVPFFLVRAALCFAVWGGTAWYLARLSAEQDRSADPALPGRLRRVSAAGLVLYFAALTFASVDWVMSLQPEWWSTIFAVYVAGGQAVSAMSLGIVTAFALGRRGRPGALVYRPQHFHDFGKMLLAWIMLWAYFALSQFVVVWAGNLPEEIPYYLDRTRGGFRSVSFLLVLLHFALPFFLLLSADLKRRAGRLAAVAGLLLVMRWVDVYWLVAPAYAHGSVPVHWLDVTALLAVGGIWLALFAANLASRPLVPLGEPDLPEVLSHGA